MPGAVRETLYHITGQLCMACTVVLLCLDGQLLLPHKAFQSVVSPHLVRAVACVMALGMVTRLSSNS